MIGRGSYGKPWFLNQVNEYLKTGVHAAAPDIHSQYQIIKSHYEALLQHYGINRGMKIARKHIGWYSKGLPGASVFRAKFNVVDNVKHAQQMISEFYAPIIEKTAE